MGVCNIAYDQRKAADNFAAAFIGYEYDLLPNGNINRLSAARYK